jgi:hypothetical protein
MAAGTDEWDGYVSTNEYHAMVNIQFSYNRARGNQDDIQNAQVDIGSLRVNFAAAGRSDADPVFACLSGIGSNGYRYQLDVDLTEQVTLDAHVTDVRGRAARERCHLDNPTETMSNDGALAMNVEDLRRTATINLPINIEDGPLIGVRFDVGAFTIVPG